MEDWTDRFTDRFNGYEMPEPEGLWADIDATVTRKRKVRSILLWSGMAGSIAAATAAIFVLAGHPGSIPDNGGRMYADRIEVLRDDDARNGWEREIPNARELSAMWPQRRYAALLEEAAGGMADEGMERVEGMTYEGMETVVEQDTEENVMVESRMRDEDGVRKEETEEIIADVEDQLLNGDGFRTIRKRQVSASLVYGNGAGNSGISQGYRTFFVSHAEGLEMNANGSTTSIMTLNGKETPAQTSTKHHLPLRAGLCIRWEFIPKLSIETGLMYTMLTSEMTSGSERYNYISKQRLNYIGVPLNLNYSFISTRLVNLYVSAGGMVEKCLGGSISTDYISEGSVAAKTSERIGVDPLQWSVNLGAGLQVNFIRTTGIFIQPGISWYFDNGSPVETIYTTQPVNFDFRFGIRHSF